MENASKALIIAGAILISIVLVSVGVIVVNALDPNQALGEMDQQAIESFNSKFVSNAGENVQGTRVKTLIQNVITSNSNNEEDRQISVVGPEGGSEATTSADLSAMRNTIKTSTRYRVVMDYATNGLVNKITITKAGGSTTK